VLLFWTEKAVRLLCMNVLFVHNDYGRFSGEEHALQNMANALASGGHHVSWLRDSSSVIGDSTSQRVKAFFSGIYSVGSRRRIEKLLDGGAFDLVQVQNLYPFLSPSVLKPCRSRGLPVVMRCPNYRLFCPNGLHLSHGQVCERCLGGREWQCVMQNCLDDRLKSLGYAARNAFARMTGMILDNVSIFVVLSQFQEQRFMDSGIPADRIEILPNIAPKMEQVDSSNHEGDAISFVGRVSPEKGILEFLDAARKLPQRKFIVAGSTDSMPDVTKLAPDNVEFKGFLRGKELDEIFYQSRLLVFPSLWFEGFPNVVAQAMACGKPVIATGIGALAEIVDDGKTGLLYDPANKEDLAQKIEFLWNNPELCREMGKAGQEKARAEYSEEKFYERLMTIYEKALQAGDDRHARA
jgi:glycosyltransferase involved in cell wall biosynthesis